MKCILWPIMQTYVIYWTTIQIRLHDIHFTTNKYFDVGLLSANIIYDYYIFHLAHIQRQQNEFGCSWFSLWLRHIMCLVLCTTQPTHSRQWLPSFSAKESDFIPRNCVFIIKNKIKISIAYQHINGVAMIFDHPCDVRSFV